MANPFYVAPPNILEALQQYDQSYKTASDDYRQSQNDAILKEVGAEIARGGISDTSLGKLFSMSRSAGVPALNAASHLIAAKQQGNKVFGNPIWGVGLDGKPALGAYDQNGNFRRIDTGGFQPNPGIKIISTPQGDYVLDSKGGLPVGGAAPNTGQPQGAPAGFYPKNYKDTEAEKVVGRETGEKAAAMGKAKMSLDNSVANLDQLQQQANELLNHRGLGRITGMTGMLPNVPGFPGADAQAKLDTLRAKVGFAALQSMRDASKTGGALGQVSDFENRLLQNSMAELQNAQTEKQIKQALQKILSQTEGMKDRLQKAYETDYAGLNRPGSNMQPGTGSPPIKGARQAPDGKWYIQDPRSGRYYEVTQ